MCGRIYNIIPSTEGFEPYLGNWPDGGLQSYNIAPTQTVPIITQDGTIQARWGLIPGWSKEFESKYSTFNARIESVSGKPLFRNAWKEKRSCIIPVGGYYEWKQESQGKQPYSISFGSLPMLLGGIWESWNDRISFTILTQASKGLLENLHHRMPLVIHPKDFLAWINERETNEDPAEWANSIQQTKISKSVNNARNDFAEILNPI
jgi:putative SOS response-associated peptidase YedK